eukprot:scaffold32152_cov22-Tisochrysis_lutea.AAC.1
MGGTKHKVDDGMVRQMCMRSRRAPAEAKRHLESHCKKLKEGYDVILSDQEHGPCMPKCNGCGEVMSSNNS